MPSIKLPASVKEWAELLAAIGIVWGSVSAAIVYLFVPPLVAQADERYDKRYVKKSDFAIFEARSTCQYTEKQIDDVSGLLVNLPEGTPDTVRNDYAKQLQKHKDRYGRWKCLEILDSVK